MSDSNKKKTANQTAKKNRKIYLTNDNDFLLFTLTKEKNAYIVHVIIKNKTLSEF